MDAIPDIEDFGRLIREQTGLDLAAEAERIARLAAVAVTRQAWRDTHLENLHAGDHPSGGIPDAQMMRFNIVTTRLVAGHVLSEETDWLALYREVADPDRLLPGDITVAELAGEEYDELADSIEAKLSTFASMEERFGRARTHAGLAYLAVMTCREWYGTPWWSDVVDVFIESLADPHSEAWRYDDPRGPEPASVADRDALRAALLSEPESLDDDGIYWCIDHGLGRVSEDALDRFRQRGVSG